MLQDVEAMEGAMTWNWNSGQQINPRFLAQNLQSRQPISKPRRNPHQPAVASSKERWEDIFAAVGSGLLDVEPKLGNNRLQNRRQAYADSNARLQPVQQSREANHFQQERPYNISGIELQVRTP